MPIEPEKLLAADGRVAATAKGSGGSQAAGGSGYGNAAHDCGNGGARKTGRGTGAGSASGGCARAGSSSRGSNLTPVADRLDSNGAHELRSTAKGAGAWNEGAGDFNLLPDKLDHLGGIQELDGDLGGVVGK
jgi:hypothetical protein